MAFPRRNWTVSTNELRIGEVALTGWGVGTILLRDETYSASSTQAISGALPREYQMRQDGDIIHLAWEKTESVYSIDHDVFFLRSPWIYFWTYFGRSWPAFYLYGRGNRVQVGSIFQERALRDDVILDLSANIAETLQLFLFWLVVDRAQWRFAFNNPG
jgi:hypothetical protein